VLFGSRRPLTILAWLVVPLLFTAAVLCLTGLGGVLLNANWRVTLSSALFGPAAAITAILAPSVEWPGRRWRWVIGIGHPVLVFCAGLILNDVSLPSVWAMVAGTPALIVLVVLLARERNKIIPIA
jgi:hypothetical protein